MNLQEQDFWRGKKVLVTGAAGLIGNEAVRKLLKLGSYVTATTYKNRRLESIPHQGRLSVVYVDLQDYKQCLDITRDIDIVIDCAAVTGGAKKQKQSQLQFARDNTIIHINIMTAAVENKVGKFGFIGSSTMYPDIPCAKEEDGFIADPWEGYLGVGWTKRYLEKMCMLFHKIGPTQFAIARTTAVYGPYDDFNLDTCHVIPAFINKISNKLDPLEVWGDGGELRNFIFVEDFVEGFLLTVEKHSTADPLNISTEEISTVKDVINYGCNYVNYNPNRHYDLNKPTMIPKRIVNVEKAKRVLSWKAKTSLKEGIEKTIDWYRNNILCIEEYIEERKGYGLDPEFVKKNNSHL